MTALTWSPQLFDAVKAMKQQDSSTYELKLSSLPLAILEKVSLASVAAKNQVYAYDWI